jgi:hypothetical protein
MPRRFGPVVAILFALRSAAAPVAAQSTPAAGSVPLSASDDVTVIGKAIFSSLGDVPSPAENVVGVAQSASQGAISARPLEARPMMRTGDVLETVPGVVISQHSGEGKANQYYLRGFNLDHGTDFSTTVAGLPVNMPTHGRGHGYSDLNFLIPELISAVQYSKGPYFADQGDFTTAGSATITYTNSLARPLVRAAAGGQGFGRALVAASTAAGQGTLLGAVEAQHNDGPWHQPDDFEKINALVRYSRGDALNGFSLTAMGYRGTWNSTDQVPARAIEDGRIGRFGTVDGTDGGESSRYSGSVEWQRTRNNASTTVSAFALGYDLNLFSNFTYFLEDPDDGDQFRQADRRFVTGGRVTHRRLGQWGRRPTQHVVGIQLRHDAIGNVGLYHTVARRPLETIRQDRVHQTSVGAFAQNETQWTPWLRTLAGLRVDGYRFDVRAGEPRNSGTDTAGLVSPKGGAVLGPWKATELYVNAGLGFHSNDARGATITVDPATGAPARRVTPLARARGAEVGVRSVRIPHLQTSVSLWTLNLESELIFVGDAGTTEPGRPSHRYGLEIASYYAPTPWLTLDADLSLSRARFTDDHPAGDLIAGAVSTVVQAGATIDSIKRLFGSARWRYFGPRALVEDGAARSKATSLVNLEAGCKLTTSLRVAVDVFNLLDAQASDIDYFYASRLPGEPAGGIADVHLHPTLPRTARLSVIVGF